MAKERYKEPSSTQGRGPKFLPAFVQQHLIQLHYKPGTLMLRVYNEQAEKASDVKEVTVNREKADKK